MIESKDIDRMIKTEYLSQASGKHNASHPVIRWDNGRYYLAAFAFFYTKEELSEKMISRPTHYCLNDLESGREIRAFKCAKNNDFSNAPYDRKYSISKEGMNIHNEPGYYEEAFGHLDKAREILIQTGDFSLCKKEYDLYLSMIVANIPADYKRFYQDLSKAKPTSTKPNPSVAKKERPADSEQGYRPKNANTPRPSQNKVSNTRTNNNLQANKTNERVADRILKMSNPSLESANSNPPITDNANNPSNVKSNAKERPAYSKKEKQPDSSETRVADKILTPSTPSSQSNSNAVTDTSSNANKAKREPEASIVDKQNDRDMAPKNVAGNSKHQNNSLEDQSQAEADASGPSYESKQEEPYSSDSDDDLAETVAISVDELDDYPRSVSNSKDEREEQISRGEKSTDGIDPLKDEEPPQPESTAAFLQDDVSEISRSEKSSENNSAVDATSSLSKSKSKGISLPIFGNARKSNENGNKDTSTHTSETDVKNNIPSNWEVPENLSILPERYFNIISRISYHITFLPEKDGKIRYEYPVVCFQKDMEPGCEPWQFAQLKILNSNSRKGHFRITPGKPVYTRCANKDQCSFGTCPYALAAYFKYLFSSEEGRKNLYAQREEYLKHRGETDAEGFFDYSMKIPNGIISVEDLMTARSYIDLGLFGLSVSAADSEVMIASCVTDIKGRMIKVEDGREPEIQALTSYYFTKSEASEGIEKRGNIILVNGKKMPLPIMNLVITDYLVRKGLYNDYFVETERLSKIEGEKTIIIDDAGQVKKKR